MVTLTPESTKGQKTYYAEALLRVGGVSQYNADQIRFDGLDGYWSMTEWAMKNTNGKVPPVGAVAWFKLATNPKKGGNAKPGSMYQDIMGIRRATPDELEGFTAPEPHASGAGGDYMERKIPHEQIDAIARNGSGAPANHWDVREQQIKLGMAFNNLTTMMANRDEFGQDAAYLELWNRWFSEAAAGKPLTPAADPESEGQASELPEDQDSPLVQAAKDMGATEQFTEPEQLPW